MNRDLITDRARRSIAEVHARSEQALTEGLLPGELAAALASIAEYMDAMLELLQPGPTPEEEEALELHAIDTAKRRREMAGPPIDRDEDWAADYPLTPLD